MENKDNIIKRIFGTAFDFKWFFMGVRFVGCLLKLINQHRPIVLKEGAFVNFISLTENADFVKENRIFDYL